MMSRHFRPNSELSRAIAKRLPHAENQLSVPGCFFNQFVTAIYTYINIDRVLIVRICNELIEETARRRKLILACGSLLAMAPLSSELRRKYQIIMEL